jgi:hypothetical protein
MMATGPEGGPYWRELRRFASEAAAAARDEDVEALGEIRMRALAERRRLIERHGCSVQVVTTESVERLRATMTRRGVP